MPLPLLRWLRYGIARPTTVLALSWSMTLDCAMTDLALPRTGTPERPMKIDSLTDGVFMCHLQVTSQRSDTMSRRYALTWCDAIALSLVEPSSGILLLGLGKIQHLENCWKESSGILPDGLPRVIPSLTWINCPGPVAQPVLRCVRSLRRSAAWSP